jgi:hypothetical protein
MGSNGDAPHLLLKEALIVIRRITDHAPLVAIASLIVNSRMHALSVVHRV